MSDVMLFGVLRMPYDMAMSDELSRRQFYDRAQQAADEIEQLQNAIADLWAGAAEHDIDDETADFVHRIVAQTMQRDLATAPQRYERRSIGDGYYDQPVLTKDTQ